MSYLIIAMNCSLFSSIVFYALSVASVRKNELERSKSFMLDAIYFLLFGILFLIGAK